MIAGHRTIDSLDDLPSDGMIVVRPWDRTRSGGWHLEGTPNDFGFVTATPVTIGTGRTSGEPREIHLRFGLDRITTMERSR